MSAGVTVSIRVPEGLPERIKAATGLPFSTVARRVLLALDASYTQRRKAHETPAANLTEDIAAAVEEGAKR